MSFFLNSTIVPNPFSCPYSIKIFSKTNFAWNIPPYPLRIANWGACNVQKLVCHVITPLTLHLMRPFMLTNFQGLVQSVHKCFLPTALCCDQNPSNKVMLGALFMIQNLRFGLEVYEFLVLFELFWVSFSVEL